MGAQQKRRPAISCKEQVVPAASVLNGQADSQRQLETAAAPAVFNQR